MLVNHKYYPGQKVRHKLNNQILNVIRYTRVSKAKSKSVLECTTFDKTRGYMMLLVHEDEIKPEKPISGRIKHYWNRFIKKIK